MIHGSYSSCNRKDLGDTVLICYFNSLSDGTTTAEEPDKETNRKDAVGIPGSTGHFKPSWNWTDRNKNPEPLADSRAEIIDRHGARDAATESINRTTHFSIQFAMSYYNKQNLFGVRRYSEIPVLFWSRVIIGTMLLAFLLMTGSCSDGENPSSSEDSIPLADLTEFVATPGDGEVLLEWTAEENSEFAGVLILSRDDGAFPASPGEADEPTEESPDTVVVYDGTGNAVLDVGLFNSTTLYYTAFTYDDVFNYSSGVTASATPVAVSNGDSSGGEENTAPLAFDLSLTTEEDTAVTTLLKAADAEGDALVFTVIDGPADGVLSGTSPDLVYTPDSYFIGVDRFTFKANDGLNDSNIAAVTVSVKDQISPSDASSFTATLDTGQVLLSWTNPTDADFTGVMVRRSTVKYPKKKNQGTLVYDGASTGVTDPVPGADTYYYTIFAYDEVPNYSGGVNASATLP